MIHYYTWIILRYWKNCSSTHKIITTASNREDRITFLFSFFRSESHSQEDSPYLAYSYAASHEYNAARPALRKSQWQQTATYPPDCSHHLQVRKTQSRTTGSDILSSRRFVDGFQLIAHLVTERNARFLGTTSGEAHRYSILTFKVVAEIIARLSLRLIDLDSVFVRYLQNEYSRIELQKQLYFSHLPLSPRTKHRAGLQSCPLPKYTVRLHFSM